MEILDLIGVLKKEDVASTTMLQRLMGWGYPRAARFMDYLEENKFIVKTEDYKNVPTPLFKGLYVLQDYDISKNLLQVVLDGAGFSDEEKQEIYSFVKERDLHFIGQTKKILQNMKCDIFFQSLELRDFKLSYTIKETSLKILVPAINMAAQVALLSEIINYWNGLKDRLPLECPAFLIKDEDVINSLLLLYYKDLISVDIFKLTPYESIVRLKAEK